MNELVKYVEELLRKSAKTSASDDAQRFSQAACNAVNAIRLLKEFGLKGENT